MRESNTEEFEGTLPDEEDFLRIEDNLEAAKRIIGEQKAFARPTIGLIILGFSCGASLVVVQAMFQENSSAANLVFTFFKDVGFGLIVASIAVIGYESLHKVRGDYERQKKLDGTVRSLQKALSTINALGKSKTIVEEIVDDLEIMRADEIGESGERILTALFSNQVKHEREFKEMIARVIRHVWELKACPTIYRKNYMEYFTWLCSNVIENNIASLSEVEKSAGKGFPVQGNFDVPSNRSIASQLLGSQLCSLVKGDLYQAMSNILFWDEDFEFLWEKNREAFRKGVKIERIFYLHDFIKSDELLKRHFDGIKDTVARHMDLTTDWTGLYEFRFLTVAQAENALMAHKTEAGDKKLNIALDSFGIYSHKRRAGGYDRLSLTVNNDQLSSVSFSRVKSDVERNRATFKLMWPAADKTNPFEHDIEYFKQATK